MIHGHIVEVLLIRFDLRHFFERFPDIVDIVDITELETCVAVVAQVLKATTFELVALRRELRAGVKNDALVALLAFLAAAADLIEQVLIICTVFTEQTRVGLAAAPNRAPSALVVVRQGGQSVFASELCGTVDFLVAHFLWHDEPPRVSLTELIVAVIECGEHGRSGEVDSHAPGLTSDISVQLPAVFVVHPV